MTASNKAARRRPMAEINIVPYIDVMLVLLVIFMITAPLLTQGVKVELPQATAEQLPPESKDPIVVTVDKQGLYFLNVGDKKKEAIDPDTLITKVSIILRRQPETPVLVRGDKEVDYGSVVSAMTLLQQAGAPSVGLITEAPVRKSGRK
jgi:biopolymer transport protein TolR